MGPIGQPIDWVNEKLRSLLGVVQREEKQDGFEGTPERWVVE
ncbi:hypothetical protein GGQ16_001420 [Salinibacter ruber]|nr:hypothetical protein [Salinibacter ruber]